jgi:hypothetical protein
MNVFIFDFDRKIVKENEKTLSFPEFFSSSVQLPENSDDLLKNGWIDYLNEDDTGEKIRIKVIENKKTKSYMNSIFNLSPVGSGGKRTGAGAPKKEVKKERVVINFYSTIEIKEYLKNIKNKSGYINDLIKKDMDKNNLKNI